MECVNSKDPHKVITWQDKEPTGAIGWIVIHNIVNGVSGGGLFMDESATLQEVKDLAYTMSLKNSLQNPVFGGGKGGIKFNAYHYKSKGVLERFLKDNVNVIKSIWCTGGDINTTTKEISDIIKNFTDMQSPFDCLANMLRMKFNINPSIEKFYKNLQHLENNYFTIDQAITGFSVFKTMELFIKSNMRKPRIIVQGFGKVGKAFCYYAKNKYNIVGICDKDWYIYNSSGIDIECLIKSIPSLSDTADKFDYILRCKLESSEDFLNRFLRNIKADIFCPCAIRYCITENILKTLVSNTFSDNRQENAYIISGANDVFKERKLIRQAFEENITVIPEWLSNSGSALLFMEALKKQNIENKWNDYIKQHVENRIFTFVKEAEKCMRLQDLNIYEASIYLANMALVKKNILNES